MTAADGIRKLGFRRWYERQLIESHLYLVTGLLSLIMVLACYEGFSLREPGLKPILMLALILGGVVLCAVAIRRYLFVLTRAEHFAEQSKCSGCGSYGRLRITGTTSLAGDPGAGAFSVECRQCGHGWTMVSSDAE